VFKRILRSFQDNKPDNPDQDKLSKFQSLIGYEFTNLSLLKEALTHTSYNSSHEKNQFERMEFLGDSVLGLVVSDKLFKGNPELDEGGLSKLKAKIVSKKFLALKAKKIKLGQYIYLSSEAVSNGGQKSKSILSDAMETLICAIFLDGGLEAVRKFISKFILQDYKKQAKLDMMKDYKSRLQEYTQSHFQEIPVYKVIKEEGPEHAKIFSVNVFIKGENAGTGKGKNKKEAHQDAARLACQKYNI